MVEIYVSYFFLFFSFTIGEHFINKMCDDDTVCRLYIRYNALRRLKKHSKYKKSN